MRYLLIGLFLLLPLSVQATSFDMEQVRGHQSSGRYAWNYQYDIGYIDNTILVDLDIRLSGADPGSTLLAKWETGIESIWSTSRFETPILFNVDFFTTGAADQAVTVTADTASWNMTHWHTIGAGGWGFTYQEEIAAHEFGHMLGLFDEHSKGAIDPVTHLVNTGGLMATLNGPTLNYYYDPFLDWYDRKLNTPVVVPDPIVTPVSVPEPTTWMLLGLGLVGLLTLRRRHPAAFGATAGTPAPRPSIAG